MNVAFCRLVIYIYYNYLLVLSDGYQIDIMKIIPYEHVTAAVADLVVSTSRHLPPDILNVIGERQACETSQLASSILSQIIENASLAVSDDLPLCQDTGVAVFFVDVGENVTVDEAGLDAAVREGMQRGYRDGDLRQSMVGDPFNRENTGDNSPAIIHWTPVLGDTLDIYFCPKGGGCENMSRIAMLSPGEGREGAMRFIVETVRFGGGKPCPPVVVGVGIGGNFEMAALMAKRALFRPLGTPHQDEYYRDMEQELLDEINNLGIGPMGLGGLTTALGVLIEAAPCHIASLPVAVNIQCHSARHGHIRL